MKVTWGSQFSSERKVARSDSFSYILATKDSLLSLGWEFGIRNNPLRLDGSLGKREHRAECRFKDSEQDTAYRIRGKNPCFLSTVSCLLSIGAYDRSGLHFYKTCPDDRVVTTRSGLKSVSDAPQVLPKQTVSREPITVNPLKNGHGIRLTDNGNLGGKK